MRWSSIGDRTYHELAFILQIACPHALEGIVRFALTECGAVDVGGEEADGGEDAGVKGGLLMVDDCTLNSTWTELSRQEHVRRVRKCVLTRKA